MMFTSSVNAPTFETHFESLFLIGFQHPCVLVHFVSLSFSFFFFFSIVPSKKIIYAMEKMVHVMG
jgi:hypothetical protein